MIRALVSLIEPLVPLRSRVGRLPGRRRRRRDEDRAEPRPLVEGLPAPGELTDLTRLPVRVLNDAGVQGYGVIEGRGVEMLLTLGTGMGCALFVEGRYVPNIELAHHPFRKGKTYEEWVGNAVLERIGKKKWNKHVAHVVSVVNPIFNPRVVYLGGGNAKHVRVSLPNTWRSSPTSPGSSAGSRWRHATKGDRHGAASRDMTFRAALSRFFVGARHSSSCRGSSR